LEQREIFRRVNLALARVDRAAGEGMRAAERINRLEHAILAKAFREEVLLPESVSRQS